ncbi:MAG: hypothetical protein ACPG21_10510 [Crocinitomicaceae bacterium]|jgi:hypothetical protein
MNKRVFTSYNKLNKAAKMAIQRSYPNGVDEILTTMKNVFSGEFFKGFVFDHEDVTYMVEWNVRNNFAAVDISEADLGTADNEDFDIEQDEDEDDY